jgi:hypothetical protein
MATRHDSWKFFFDRRKHHLQNLRRKMKLISTQIKKTKIQQDPIHIEFRQACQCEICTIAEAKIINQEVIRQFHHKNNDSKTWSISTHWELEYDENGTLELRFTPCCIDRYTIRATYEIKLDKNLFTQGTLHSNKITFMCLDFREIDVKITSKFGRMAWPQNCFVVQAEVSLASPGGTIVEFISAEINKLYLNGKTCHEPNYHSTIFGMPLFEFVEKVLTEQYINTSSPNEDASYEFAPYSCSWQDDVLMIIKLNSDRQIKFMVTDYITDETVLSYIDDAVLNKWRTNNTIDWSDLGEYDPKYIDLLPQRDLLLQTLGAYNIMGQTCNIAIVRTNIEVDQSRLKPEQVADTSTCTN